MAPPGLEEQLAWQDSLSEDTCCSYEEWRWSGYQVQRGQRSHFQDALGVPQFTIEQVLDLRGDSG